MGKRLASQVVDPHLHRTVSLRKHTQKIEVAEEENIFDEEVHPSTARQWPPPEQPNLITYGRDVVVHDNSCECQYDCAPVISEINDTLTDAHTEIVRG